MPRTSVKGQVLADLVAEFAECPEEVEMGNEALVERLVGVASIQGLPPWELYIDGAANQRGLGVGLVLVSPEKITIEKSLRLNFSAMNNEAEYEALLKGMVMVQKIGGKAVRVFSDSKLVVGQVRGDLEARDSRMQEYLGQVRSIQEKFEIFYLSHVPWEHPCRFIGHPCHVLSPGFASGSISGRPIHANFGASWCCSDPSDHVGSKLDGFYITILGKRCTA